ncbi:hypothetical protein FOZ61_010507 [Perkinsus olseni]|uniref:Major facilitator superfamily (MFS) profile domain-containing protein n=1 Tax=Perkinsus olseni TaxID=32597 RepID=A0A7J6LA78_PEROL|nr:hypothetical protein FOL46_008006 [Perkinsus olseni]KAF4665826.1 hypothetical protein FOZ61_010507 [Perkinsus olseni]
MSIATEEGQSRIPLLPGSRLNASTAPRVQTYHFVLVFMSFVIDYLGVSRPFNILPMLVDKRSARHLRGCEDLDQGLALSLVLVSHSVGMIISPPIMGRLSDEFGRKPLLLASMLGVSVGYGLMASSESYWPFILYRFITGLAGGGRPVVSAFIAENAPDPDSRTTYLGYLGMIPGFCICVAPSIGGILAIFGLWVPFLVNFLWAGVEFVLLFLFLPSCSFTPTDNNRHEVLPSSAMIVHETSLDNDSRVSRNIYTLLFSMSTLSMLTIMQLGYSSPLVMRDLFSMTPLTMGLSNFGDGIFIVLGTRVFIYLRNRIRFTSSAIGTVSYVLYGFSSLIAPLTLGNVIAYFALKWVLLGIFSSMFQDALPNMVAELTPDDRLGAMMGYLSFAQGIGRLLATIVTGPLLFYSPPLPFLMGGIQALVAGSMSLCLHRKLLRV